MPGQVNVSELGLVTTGGKVVWGEYPPAFFIYILYILICLACLPSSINMKAIALLTIFIGKYAQVTNNPENDGAINAVLLV